MLNLNSSIRTTSLCTGSTRIAANPAYGSRIVFDGMRAAITGSPIAGPWLAAAPPPPRWNAVRSGVAVSHVHDCIISGGSGSDDRSREWRSMPRTGSRVATYTVTVEISETTTRNRGTTRRECMGNAFQSKGLRAGDLCGPYGKGKAP